MTASIPIRRKGSLNGAIPGSASWRQRISVQTRKKSPSREGPRRELRPFEVRALLLKVRFRLAAALVNLATVTPVAEPDRSAGLHEARNSCVR